MTDNKIKLTANPELLDGFLEKEDEQLLQSFFQSCQQEIPDDGFSDRVMSAIPQRNQTYYIRYVWMAACAIVGVVGFVLDNGWLHVRDLMFSLKINTLLSMGQAVDHVGTVVSHSNFSWLTTLAGIAVIMTVWGYNKMMDSSL